MPKHGHGIGDAIMMIPICQAIADANPDAHVRAVVRENRVPWVHLGYPYTLTYDDILKHNAPTFNDVWPQLWESPGGDKHAVDAGLTRHELWLRDAGKALKQNLAFTDVSFTKPKIPAEVRAWAADLHARQFKNKRLIFISPEACSMARTWPIRHWAELVDGLLCYGHTIVGIRTKGGEFLDGVTWMEDSTFPADRTAAMFERASLVIGNDSGMVHVAGFVGTPALAICAPTHGKTVFGSYPTVRWVQSEYFCSGCLGLTRDYNPRWCTLGCNAMQAIPSKTVLEKAVSMLVKSAPATAR